METDGRILGVSLARESSPRDDSLDLPLGVVALTLSTAETKLSDLRNVIVTQIPSSVPTQFSFITHEGWPIKTSQEAALSAHHVVSTDRTLRLLRSYAKPKVGIMAAGRAMGFIFIDLCSPLPYLRDAITQQLSTLLQESYQFVDGNGWPVAAQQESHLNVYDLLHQSVVRVSPLGCLALDEADSGISSSELASLPPACKRLKASLPKQLTFQSNKDLDRSLDAAPNGKQLLLSYVRAEAAQHALILKEELNTLGFSVFLDVHEIKLGTDWQDALNFAVRHCEVFIPLITPRYGETQWTNREVKLADVLGKYILPVNFLHQWPPNCLAIQLATTQFVPWGPSQASPLLSPSDLYAMDRDQAQSVAQKLADRLSVESMHSMASISPGSTSSLTKKISMLRSCPFALPPDLSQLSQHREGIPMVLICLHPKQQHYGDKLQALLSDYEVCFSTNLSEQESDSELFSQESMIDIDQCDGFHGAFLAGTQSLVRFQAKADEAGVVIFIVSEEFIKSKTCRQQVFYCEHRKCVIPVRAEDFCMPGWMSMLIGTGTFEDIRTTGFEAAFSSRIRRAFSCEANADSAKMEAALSAKVCELKLKLPRQIFVYVAGSTTFYGSHTKELCQAIGRDLALLNNIHIVTGGFYGVGQTLSKSFHAENGKKKNGAVYHILPERDDQVVPFGKTVFAGDCVRERENIVSRAFDICILIEGGPGAAHEAEQFAWSGNTVIPIVSTGGAASGKFNVPSQIFEKPLGVRPEDWQMLSNEEASSDLISRSVSSIVETVRDRLLMDSPSVEPAKMHSFFSQSLSASQNSEPFTALRSLPRKRGSLSRDPTVVY